jgi:LysM repeat protein
MPFFVLLTPIAVNASFFSSFLGYQAYANNTSGEGTDSNDNSQTMALLQRISQIDASEDVTILSDALLPRVSPLGASLDGSPDPSSDQTSVYVVRDGDSISVIADMFGVTTNTILAANDIKKGDTITPGEVLFILPISGVEHTVKNGETLQSIAKLLNADVNDIIAYNGLSLDAKLAVGDELLIPGGDMADEGGDKPAANLGTAQATDKNYYDAHPIKNVAGYFINPVPTGIKTQGLHGPGHRGIDIGAPTGTPIYASASGVVSLAHGGWSGGYGNMVIIDHPNGTKTLYAHMSKIGTQTGATVKQGQVIGYVGSTGHSTGPHLHFEVFNAKNPGADWSWKN